MILSTGVLSTDESLSNLYYLPMMGRYSLGECPLKNFLILPPLHEVPGGTCMYGLVCLMDAWLLILKFRLGTHGLFEELDWHAGGDGSQKCRNCGACRELVEHVLFQ